MLLEKFIFLVLFEIMGRGLIHVMWNETVNEAMISVALQFLIGGGVIKYVCPVTLSNTSSVLHRDHSNGLT